MSQDTHFWHDVLETLKLTGRLSWRRSLQSWVYVPIGICGVLSICFGVDQLFSLSPVYFPASVAMLIILFFGLIACQSLLGDRKAKAVVRIVDVPSGFALRYINVFFTPSFVLLPLSPSVGGAEIGKIIAVFLLGFILMLTATAYLVRSLQVIFRTSKRAMSERAEELGEENDQIPLNQRPIIQPNPTPSPSVEGEASTLPNIPAASVQNPATAGQPLGQLDVQQTIATPILRQNPLPRTRPQKWATSISGNLDVITYTLLFSTVGLPLYYALGYAMPMQLCLNVLAYLTALSLPLQWRRFMHPVLVSSGMTILGIWILALCRGQNLQDGLLAYSTKIKYVQLLTRHSSGLLPGAGDVFGSILDASIVALALPMFQYRKELNRHFYSIIIPNIALSVASLFGYPSLCYAIGISSRRSLSFAARSLTLALANPATSNLGGDLNLVAVLCIMSGIMGVLVGPPVLKWLKVPEDDYVTRGVALGSNSSAIATALLLVSDPRAAALSSLSMGFFGTVTVALTSIPPVVKIIIGMVGLDSV